MSETGDLQPEEEQPFRYVHSAGFVEALETLKATLWVTTYQAGKVCAFRSSGGRLSMLARTFDKAMGLAVDDTRMAIATTYQVWQLRNETILAPKIKPENTHDACYLPRSSHMTGNIDAHEIAWAGDELWIVNTLFSCLCTLDPKYSFLPRWRPSFISDIKRNDRCHLNGLTMVDGRPKYVTCFAETDTAKGWREHKVDGGLLIDVPSGEIVARGFSMPHSPRIYQGKVWLLDSGNGRLVTVDPKSGQHDVVAELPGYTRGLAFHGKYAFIGLSKVRETSVFGGVRIAELRDEIKCGIAVLEISTGQVVGIVEFEQTVEEIFDVCILPDIRFPTVVGFAKDTIQHACVIGPEEPIG